MPETFIKNFTVYYAANRPNMHNPNPYPKLLSLEVKNGKPITFVHNVYIYFGSDSFSVF